MPVERSAPRELGLTRLGFPADSFLRRLLFGGILLRAALFKPLYPRNNDDHFGVITYILEHHSLPLSGTLSQAYHPPLYYLLAAPFAALAGVRGAEVLSFALSVLNLWMIARIVSTTELIGSSAARRHALALAMFLPQFLLFGLYVSNDTLSYPVGTLTFLIAFAYIGRPDLRALLALGAVIGIGLLTKGTFLAFVPVALVLVLVVGWRHRLPVGRQIRDLALVALVMGAVGAYKFVENQRALGRAVVHNLDFPASSLPDQKGTIQGIGSFVSFNVPRLLATPYEHKLTTHSVPLMLYATTWYPYLLESNFRTTQRKGPWRKVAALLCLTGLVPTALALLGLGSVFGSARTATRLRDLPEREYVTTGRRLTAAALLLSVLAIVIAAGLKYDVWSCFQGRLLFPAIVGTLLLVAAGYEAVIARAPRARLLLNGAFAAMYGAFGLYYVVEAVGAIAR